MARCPWSPWIATGGARIPRDVAVKSNHGSCRGSCAHTAPCAIIFAACERSLEGLRDYETTRSRNATTVCRRAT
jgi:hypothetical protein